MASITEQAVRDLARFRPQGSPVVSCYLDVDGSRFVHRGEVEAQLDRLMRDARSRGNGRHAAAAADLERIEAHVRDGFDRSRTRAVAMFSCTAEGFWNVVELPVSVPSMLIINESPYVRPLEMVVTNHERLGVLLVDKQRARVLLAEVGEITEHTGLFDALPRHEDDGGEWDRDHVRSHVDAAVDHHIHRAAAAALSLHEEHGFAHLLIGVADELWSQLESCLHPYVAERFAGRLPVLPPASEAEIRAAVSEAEAEVERARQAAAVETLRAEVGRSGRGVAGLDPTLGALAEHRIDTLLVSRGYTEPGWRCGCGRVAHVGPTCALCGASMVQVDDVVEEIIEDALGQSVRVLICNGNADLDVLGRIGGLLRF